MFTPRSYSDRVKYMMVEAQMRGEESKGKERWISDDRQRLLVRGTNLWCF